jgi:hypothetical protein
MMNAVPSGPPEPDDKRAAGTGGGGPPHYGDLERRVTVLETRFDTILPTLATKADLAELRLDLSEKMSDLRRELTEKMDALRVELHVALTNIMKWCVGVAMTLFVGMVSQGLYLGAQINNLAARLPPAAAVAPAPAQPAASPARRVPHAQPPPSSAPESG